MQMVERRGIKTPSLPPQARAEGEHGETVWMETLRECSPVGVLLYLGPFPRATEFGKGASTLARGCFHSRAQFRNATLG